MLKRIFKSINFIKAIVDFVLLLISTPIEVAIYLLDNFIQPVVNELITVPYDTFDNSFQQDIWNVRLPPVSPDFEVIFETETTDVLTLIAKKRLVPSTDQGNLLRIWDGPEIASKKGGYNYIQVRMMVDFDASTAKKGNLYIRGNSERFLYLLGIDSISKDIFFHCWDEYRQTYIKVGGRIHLKDYFEQSGNQWITLAIKWGLEGVKYIIFDQNDDESYAYSFNPPPDDKELCTAILRDARMIYLNGVKEFCIRTDLQSTDNQFSTLIAKVQYVKVKYAPLFWKSQISWLAPRIYRNGDAG